MGTGDFRSMKELFPHLIRQLSGHSHSAFAITPLWRELVGPTVSKHSSPIAIENQTLIIRVTNRQWKQVIEAQSSQLLEKINDVHIALNVKALKLLIPPT